MTEPHRAGAGAVLLAALVAIFGVACGPPDDLSHEERRERVRDAAREIAEESCRRGNRIGCPDSARSDSAVVPGRGNR